MTTFKRKRFEQTSAIFCAVLGAVILFGCSAKQIRPEANRIIVTRHAAQESCRFIGNVVGEQGGSFAGVYTSNKNLMQGALNDLKNQAYQMGGNYVVLEESKAGETSSGTWYAQSSHQTDVTNMGTVYKCPSALLSRVKHLRTKPQVVTADD